MVSQPVFWFVSSSVEVNWVETGQSVCCLASLSKGYKPVNHLVSQSFGQLKWKGHETGELIHETGELIHETGELILETDELILETGEWWVNTWNWWVDTWNWWVNTWNCYRKKLEQHVRLMHGGVGLPDNILQTAREYTTQNIYLFNIHNYFPMGGGGTLSFKKKRVGLGLFLYFCTSKTKIICFSNEDFYELASYLFCLNFICIVKFCI